LKVKYAVETISVERATFNR